MKIKVMKINPQIELKFEKWVKSPEGYRCMKLSTLSGAISLQNRLLRAFRAGVKSAY